jgi:hypothetical protein
MRTHNRLSQAPRIQEKRRGVRLNSRVPVVIQWTRADESLGSHEGFTRIVGPYGCLALLPEDLAIEQSIVLLNSVTGESNPGIVVWKGERQGDGWETGIELTQPAMGFWGLEL